MYKVVVGYLWPKGDKSLAIFWIRTMSASTLSITVNSTTSIIVNSRKQTGNWMSPKALSRPDILSGRNSLPRRVQSLSNTNICTQVSFYPIYRTTEKFLGMMMSVCSSSNEFESPGGTFTCKVLWMAYSYEGRQKYQHGSRVKLSAVRSLCSPEL